MEGLKLEGVLPGATVGEVLSSGRTERGSTPARQINTHLFQLPSRPGSPAEETLLGGDQNGGGSGQIKRKEREDPKWQKEMELATSARRPPRWWKPRENERELLRLEMPS